MCHLAGVVRLPLSGEECPQGNLASPLQFSRTALVRIYQIAGDARRQRVSASNLGIAAQILCIFRLGPRQSIARQSIRSFAKLLHPRNCGFRRGALSLRSRSAFLGTILDETGLNIASATLSGLAAGGADAGFK